MKRFNKMRGKLAGRWDGYKRPCRPQHDTGTKGRGPWGAIGDTNSRSTSGPNLAAEDIRIITIHVEKGENITGKAVHELLVSDGSL